MTLNDLLGSSWQERGNVFLIGRAGSSPPLPSFSHPLPFPSSSLSHPSPFPSLTPLPFPFPLPPLRSIGPYITARGTGGALKLPSGSGQSPAAKRFLVHFRAENASGDNHCLDEFLDENPLIPYLTREDIAVRGSGRNLVSVLSILQ